MEIRDSLSSIYVIYLNELCLFRKIKRGSGHFIVVGRGTESEQNGVGSLQIDERRQHFP